MFSLIGETCHTLSAFSCTLFYMLNLSTANKHFPISSSISIESFTCRIKIADFNSALMLNLCKPEAREEACLEVQIYDLSK